MTSPQTTESDVVAEMATAGKIEPPLSLTDAGQNGQAEVNATVTPAPDQVAQSPKADSVEVRGEVIKQEDGEQMTEENFKNDTATDAAIPITENDPQLQLPAIPANMLDYTPLGPVDSLLAYAQPFPVLPNADYAQLALPPALDGLDTNRQPFLDPSPYIHEQDETRISAYAKLEFSDGEFYMNTYSVVLGRDQAAMRVALRREQEERRRIDEEASTMKEPKTPVNFRREHSRYSKSVISESGGILRDVDDAAKSKANKKSKSTGSSSRHPSRRNSLVQQNESFDYQAQPLASHKAAENEARLHPAALRPSPHDCPLVTIHPPATESASGYKAISRSHVKIAYSLKKHLFEAHILGRNGAFVDDNFCYQDQVVPLKSGSMLQIGGVQVRFVLPDVAIGETGAEQRVEYEDHHVSDRYAEGGKEMSFDFEESIHDGIARETSSDLSEGNRGSDDEQLDQEIGSADEDDDEEEQEDVDMMDDSDRSEDMENLDFEAPDTAAASVSLKPLVPEKKRGPGRPPKNGIMSKREQQLAKKEAAARAAAEAGMGQNLTNPQLSAQMHGSPKAKKTIVKAEPLPDGTIPPPPVKNKVGRPRKHPRPDTPPVQREKRKYTKRKPKEPKEGEAKEGGSGDEETKEKKEKPPKPPRSPTPTFNEADLTPEQLAKPQANYVTLIHEALSSSAAGMMSLPQIYRAIMRKYPFFVLKTTTTGWQSSVRHNLSQHHAFTKVKRDGKGWMWAIVEGVSIEKEKKRRVTPPPQIPHGHLHHQPIYQAGHPPHLMHGQYPIPPPGYMLHPNIRPGQPYMGPPPPSNGLPYPHQPQPMSMAPHQHPQAGFIPSIPQIAAIAPPQQYSSPYAQKPASQAPTPQTTQSMAQQPLQQQQQQQQQPQANEQKQSVEQLKANPSPPSHSGTPMASNDTAPLVNPGPYQNHTHPPTQFRQQQSSQAPPTPQKPAQSPIPTLSGRPQHPQSVISAVETFRANLLSTLKDKTDNAEEVLASAVNRVLGYITQSAVPGDLYEPQIMEALKSVLSKVPEYKPIQATGFMQPSLQQNAISPSTNAQANQDGTQQSASQQPSKSTGHQIPAQPAVMRPSFGGAISRPSSTPVPRPSMTNSTLTRTNSASPAPLRVHRPSSVEAVAASSETVPSVPSESVSNGDLNSVALPSAAPATTQEPAMASDPSPTTKQVSLVPLSTPAFSPAPTPVMSPTHAEPQSDVVDAPQLAGAKRTIQDLDGESTNDMPELKRVATSGPPRITT